MKKRTLSKTSTGFTLLELMMVVVIIGILATIALPQYFRSAERARTAEALALLSSIRSSELRYRAQSNVNVYTTDLTSLDIDVRAATPTWTFTVDGTAAGSQAVATRSGTGGTCSGFTIEMDLDLGGICAPGGCAQEWNLPVTADGCT